MDYTNEETWIGKDFQGWPICKRTLKELFKDLNLVSEDGSVNIPASHPILNIYPKRLIDDGMGWGISEEFFVSASYDGKDTLNFFTEPFNKDQVDSLKEEKRIYDRKRREYLEAQNDEYNYGHNIPHPYPETEEY